MSGYVLSPRARRDLVEIWNYSVDRWSIEQADQYLLRIRVAIEAVANDPRRGRACYHIRQGYHQFAAGNHMLFFRIAGSRIVVVRILHQNMDFERHL